MQYLFVLSQCSLSCRNHCHLVQSCFDTYFALTHISLQYMSVTERKFEFKFGFDVAAYFNDFGIVKA
jgi:hypothetical protein